MSFANSPLLWLLLVPVAILCLEALLAGSSQAARWPRIGRLWAGPRGVAPAAHARSHRFRWRLALGAMGLVAALARPQWGKIEETVFDQSREVLIALDLSRSMLAADVKPTRLDRARLLVSSLLDKLHGERVGLLLFSGTAFLQSPLSPDYEILREFLPALDPAYLPEGGTDYDRLLRVAGESFSHEAGADRYLIVLSDGEAQDEHWRQRIENLKTRNVRIVALGIGTEAGSVVPGADGSLVKDERGAVVLSKLNPTTLQQLASATGGAYADASHWVDLPALLQQTVERGKQGSLAERKTVRLGERFQWFLAPALLLLAWSYGCEFPVRPKARDLRRPAAALLVAALGIGAPPASALTLSQPSPQLKDAPPPPALPQTVARLAAQPALSAADCAKLAGDTLDFGQTTLQTGQPVKPGIVRDGLDAVGLGERLDPKAADWPDLRRRLEELLKPPPPQDKPQDKQDPKKNDESKSQDSSKTDPPSPDEKSQQPKPDSQPANDPPKPDPSAPSPPPQSPPPGAPPPTQKIGGEPPPDRELRENPQLAEPLQKLEQVREHDKPATLFQLMQDNEAKPAAKPKKDW